MRRVVVESPYRADSQGDVEIHLRYLRSCLADCLSRGETPYASHALLTQPGVLDDRDPIQHDIGIAAGMEWREAADATVVYTDLGITNGMRLGVKHAHSIRQAVEMRELVGWGSGEKADDFAKYATSLWGS